MIGRKVCFTNANGLKRYGRITAVSDDGELVQVAWQAWPRPEGTRLASLPHPNEADRRHCAANTSWSHAPGVDTIEVPGRDQPLKLAPIVLVDE